MDELRPEVLFVPTGPRDRSGQTWVELRRLSDGRTALPVYTSIQELVRSRGLRQPWIGLDNAGMTAVQRSTGYNLVLVNADLSPLGESSEPQVDPGQAEDEPPFNTRNFMERPHGTYRPQRK